MTKSIKKNSDKKIQNLEFQLARALSKRQEIEIKKIEPSPKRHKSNTQTEMSNTKEKEKNKNNKDDDDDDFDSEVISQISELEQTLSSSMSNTTTEKDAIKAEVEKIESN